MPSWFASSLLKVPSGPAWNSWRLTLPSLFEIDLADHLLRGRAGLERGRRRRELGLAQLPVLVGVELGELGVEPLLLDGAGLLKLALLHRSNLVRVELPVVIGVDRVEALLDGRHELGARRRLRGLGRSGRLGRRGRRYAGCESGRGGRGGDRGEHEMAVDHVNSPWITGAMICADTRSDSLRRRRLPLFPPINLAAH